MVFICCFLCFYVDCFAAVIFAYISIHKYSQVYLFSPTPPPPQSSQPVFAISQVEKGYAAKQCYEMCLDEFRWLGYAQPQIYTDMNSCARVCLINAKHIDSFSTSLLRTRMQQYFSQLQVQYSVHQNALSRHESENSALAETPFNASYKDAANQLSVHSENSFFARVYSLSLFIYYYFTQLFVFF